MSSDTLRTSVDDLYELVLKKGKISLDDVSKELKLPIATVQSVVDFLVEEKVLGIEYKFTTPFVYVAGEKNTASLDTLDANPLQTKEEFYRKAEQRGIPSEKTQTLWIKYLEQNISRLKKNFYERAFEKNLKKEEIDLLWNRYIQHIS